MTVAASLVEVLTLPALALLPSAISSAVPKVVKDDSWVDVATGVGASVGASVTGAGTGVVVVDGAGAGVAVVVTGGGAGVVVVVDSAGSDVVVSLNISHFG